MFEIIKGQKTSSYFLIAPVKVVDVTKDTDSDDNVDGIEGCAISIEEDDVEIFLYHFLKKHFDETLPENQARRDVAGFEWYLTYNFYTFDAIKEIIMDIKVLIKKLLLDYNNPNLDIISHEYDWLVDILRGKLCSRVNPLPEEQEIKDRIEKSIEAYYKFIFYLEDMMEKGVEEGYNLISFMGP